MDTLRAFVKDTVTFPSIPVPMSLASAADLPVIRCRHERRLLSGLNDEMSASMVLGPALDRV